MTRKVTNRIGETGLSMLTASTGHELRNYTMLVTKKVKTKGAFMNPRSPIPHIEDTSLESKSGLSVHLLKTQLFIRNSPVSYS